MSSATVVIRAANPSSNSSALRRLGSAGVTVTGDWGAVVMRPPGNPSPVPATGEVALWRWALTVARARCRAGRGAGRWWRRGACGGGRCTCHAHRQHRTTGQFVDLGDRLVLRPAGQPGDHLSPFGGTHVADRHQPAAEIGAVVGGA